MKVCHRVQRVELYRQFGLLDRPFVTLAEAAEQRIHHPDMGVGGFELERTLALANAAGAIAASRLACADDFASLPEIEALIAEHAHA